MPTSKVKVIFGPPGTGKTTTLLNILDAELQSGVPPSRIAFVSFTRKAANEARQRAAEKFSLSIKDFLYFRTIHSLAYKRLSLRPGDVMQRSDWDELGERVACKFSGEYDLQEGMESLMRSQEGDRVLALIGLARARRLHWSEGYDPRAFRGAAMTRERYVAIAKSIDDYKAQRALVDFTDMLEHALERTAPLDIDVAIIDEAQDLSVLQWEVCDHMFSRAARLYVAGDDDQAIYRWAGADVRRFQGLRHDERQVLDHSYRLPANIWREACGILESIRERVPKTWGPRSGDAGRVTAVAAPEYAPLNNGEDWLVLSRTRFVVKQLSNTLFYKGIPCTVFGRSTVVDKHVTAMKAWTALQAGESLTGDAVKALYDCMSDGVPEDFDPSTLPKFELFTYDRLQRDFGLRVPLRAEWFVALSGIAYSQCQYYERLIENGFAVAARPRIHLNTIHSVKGGECDNVLLLTDITPQQSECLRKPSTTDCDDEHRVFYVGATRARKALYLARAASSNEYRMPCLTAS
jgi:superfamily I DNA/RNA helicase